MDTTFLTSVHNSHRFNRDIHLRGNARFCVIRNCTRRSMPRLGTHTPPPASGHNFESIAFTTAKLNGENLTLQSPQAYTFVQVDDTHTDPFGWLDTQTRSSRVPPLSRSLCSSHVPHTRATPRYQLSTKREFCVCET